MRKIAIFLVSVALVGGVVTPAMAKNPAGTTMAQIGSREISGALCAKVWGTSGNYKFVAGKWVNKKQKLYVPFKSLAANDAKAAKKTKSKNAKKKLEASSASWTKKAKTFQPKCNTVNALKVSLAGKTGVAQGNTSVSSMQAINGSGTPELRSVVGAGMNVFSVNAQGRFESMFPHLAELIAARNAQCSNYCGSLPTVKGMISGPNDKIYLIFDNKFNFSDLTDFSGMSSAGSCMIAVVSTSSTSLECVDNELFNSYSWTNSNQGNPSIQFDATGRTYYKGQFVRSGGMQNTNNFYTAIRRNVNGVIKDMVQGSNIQIQDFITLPNGDLIVQGSTINVGTMPENWVRLYPSNGPYKDLADGGWGGFMRLFPDGNVYFRSNTGSSSLSRYVSETHEVDGIYTFTNPNSSNSCCNLFMGDLDFGTPGSQDDYVFTLSGTNATQLWPQSDEVAPVARVLPLEMSHPKIIEGAGSFLLISGSEKEYNPNQTLKSVIYKTKILNPLTGAVTEVTSASDIEVYALAYAGNGIVILNGKNRLGATIVGKVSVNPSSFGEFTVTQTNSGRVDDIQLFE